MQSFDRRRHALERYRRVLTRSWHCAGAVELRNTLSEIFSVDLPATLALDYPTPSAIAAFISANLSPAAPAGVQAAQPKQRAVVSAVPRQIAPPTSRRQRGARTSAIVGGSARFPGGALDAADFWRHIMASKDLPEQVLLRLS